MILAALVGIQAFAMAVDEFVFHRRRGLPAWERWGHPIDTLGVLGAVSIPLFCEPTFFWLRAFVVASVFSCLLVTKDEWVHARVCTPAEQWVHALLFLIHPVVLGYLGWGWWEVFAPFPHALVVGIWAMLWVFCLYQLVYWMGRRERS